MISRTIDALSSIKLINRDQHELLYSETHHILISGFKSDIQMYEIEMHLKMLEHALDQFNVSTWINDLSELQSCGENVVRFLTKDMPKQAIAFGVEKLAHIYPFDMRTRLLAMKYLLFEGTNDIENKAFTTYMEAKEWIVYGH
jgi:hypothetical protein